MVSIGRRDLEIFKLIHESRGLNFKTIRSVFFDNIDLSTVNRRLRKLSNNGFLSQKNHYLDGNSERFYNLNHKSLDLLRTNYSENYTNIEGTQCPIHDLNLYKIRSRIEKNHHVTEYYTESMIQSSPGILDDYLFESLKVAGSDAYFKIQKDSNEYRIVLEYERTRKSILRTFEKCLRYSDVKVDFILFIVDDKNLLDLVIKSCENMPQLASRIGCCLLQDIDQESLKFIGTDQRVTVTIN